MAKFDTWLNDSDIERIWKVVHGELPEFFVSKEEMEEFASVVDQAGKKKWKITSLQ